MRRSQEWMTAQKDLDDTLLDVLIKMKEKAKEDNDEVFVKVIEYNITKYIK